MNNKITVIGAGSFGTALAVTLTDKGYDTYIWGRKKSQLALMEETRENPHYLPGIKLPRELKMIHDMKTALKDASIVVFAVPAQNFRKVFEEAVVYMPSDAVAVNVAKGIEKGSLMRLSQIAMQIKTDVKYAVLSGPSHAEEIARKLPS